MLFTLVSAALWAGFAYSAPATKDDSALGVYATTDPDWGYRERTGNWSHFALWPGECLDLSGTAFDKTISSFGPDVGTWCTVYASHDCTGEKEPQDRLRIWNPGYARVGNFGWDNKIGSFNCSRVVTKN